MPDYRERIEAARAYAISLADYTAASAMARFDHLPDDAPFPIEPPETLLPYQIVVTTKDDYRRLLLAAYDVLGARKHYGPDEISTNLHYCLRHEGQHVEAARQLHATKTWYGVRYRPDAWHCPRSSKV